MAVPSDDCDADAGSFNSRDWLFFAVRFFPNRSMYEAHLRDKRKVSQQASDVKGGFRADWSEYLASASFFEDIFSGPSPTSAR